MKKTIITAFLLMLLFLGGCVIKKEAPANEPVASEPLASSSTEVAMTPVKVFFGNTKLNPGSADCSEVFLVSRFVPKSKEILPVVLKELFRGPGEGEKAQGYSSFFSSETENILKSVKVVEGVAYVNLEDIRSLIPNASTSCGSAQLLAEIETTLKQFSAVKKVALAINGDPNAFYEWLQLGCPEGESYCDPLNWEK